MPLLPDHYLIARDAISPVFKMLVIDFFRHCGGGYDVLYDGDLPYLEQALRLAKPQPGEVAIDMGTASARLLVAMKKKIGPSGVAIGIELFEELFTGCAGDNIRGAGFRTGED